MSDWRFLLGLREEGAKSAFASPDPRARLALDDRLAQL